MDATTGESRKEKWLMYLKRKAPTESEQQALTEAIEMAIAQLKTEAKYTPLAGQLTYVASVLESANKAVKGKDIYFPKD